MIARRLLVVASRFPYGTQESYLLTELGELVKYFDRIAVVPMRQPEGPVRFQAPDGVEVLHWPLINAELLRRAASAFKTHPSLASLAVSQVLRSRDPGRAKNFAVIVKGLALADWAMEHKFDHIHAYWLSTPATMAFIAATTSGIPWSSTAHRWDIYERNAFDVKERTAAFVRTISSRGTADIEKRMPALADRVLQLRLGTNVPPKLEAPAPLDRTFRIVCPAALVPVKGHVDLFAALCRLRARANHRTLYGCRNGSFAGTTGEISVRPRHRRFNRVRRVCSPNATASVVPRRALRSDGACKPVGRRKIDGRPAVGAHGGDGVRSSDCCNRFRKRQRAYRQCLGPSRASRVARSAGRGAFRGLSRS